jgi:bifunctional UDP-N-acetylglucosamine pyrophosphorylase/glucosamine-1-phosphate N-acetyltransferase
VGHEKETIADCLRWQPVEFLDVSGAEAGTGGAIEETMARINDLPETVLVVNGDTPLVQSSSLVRLLNARAAAKSGVAVATAITPDYGKYGHGAFIRNEDGTFKCIEHHAITAKRLAKGEVNTGTYAFPRDVLVTAIKQLQPASDGHLHFSDILSVVRGLGIRIDPVLFEDFSEFVSVNTREHLNEVERRAGSFAHDR